MKNVFEKVKAVCDVCGEPVDERYKRGNKYYCATHYETTSPAELIENKFQEKRAENYHKIFGN